MEQSENGPYLQAAFFCERLLEEADGVLSAIRIVDDVILQGDALATPPERPVVNLTLFIALKAGEARPLRPDSGNGAAVRERRPTR